MMIVSVVFFSDSENSDNEIDDLAVGDAIENNDSDDEILTVIKTLFGRTWKIIMAIVNNFLVIQGLETVQKTLMTF